MNTDRNINEKKLTIRNIVITVLVIVFFTGIIIVYYRMLYNEKRNNIIKTGEMTAKESAEHIDQYLSTNIDSVKLAAYTLDEMLREQRTDDEIQDYLVGQSTAVRSAVIENSTGLYGYINGRFFSGTNWEPPEGYDATVRPWYTRPMENPGEITILDPYIDVQSGNVMLALGKTLCDGVSVISVDVSLDQIQKLTEYAVNSGNSDMEMLLNDKGVVVAHSNMAEVGKNYYEENSIGNEIVKRLDKGDSYFEFVYEGSNYIVYVADMQNGWFCISVKDATNVFGSLNSILIITIMVVMAIVLIISIIMTRSNRYLHMSARAMAASEAKSEFLSNMSHEIRTPINAMLGMNEMILRESEDQMIITYAEKIKTAGRNLLGLVNNILDFSKIEAGKIEISNVDYDLSAVINDLINMVHNRAEDKSLIFYKDVDRDIPRFLSGDELRIKQIISNLLTNAVKYTEKGSISFTVGYARTDEDADGIMLNVSVKDTGIGIKEEDMQRLFSQFERIEEDRNRHIEGTGLGMSITRNLLEMMGSDLSVESVYGEGSTFSFSVRQKVTSWEPIGDYETYYEEHKEADKYRAKFTAEDARILVVDDNPMNIMVFKSLVKQTGVQIDTANSGDEGIRLSRDNKYDLIFLDHMMPEKDGIETLREIRGSEDNPNATTPTVCLTANAISGARDKYIDAGFDDYLTKPIDPDELEDMMYEYIPEEMIKKCIDAEADDQYSFENSIPKVLTELSGSLIDTTAGLKNSGTADSYMALLKFFYESIDEKTEELNRFYEENDYRNYTIKVHALKSSARIIGAGAFGEKAQRLENAGKAEDIEYIRNHHASFMDEYARFRELLAPVFSEYEQDNNKPEADPDLMADVFEEIKAAAGDMDCERLDSIFAEMEEYSIPKENKTLYDKLLDATEKYEYKTILKLMEQG